MIIYKATNTMSGNVYIGQTVKTLEERIHQHTKITSKGKSKFSKALKSYGIENFDWDVIYTATTKEELNQLEIFYINEYDSIKNGYNMVEGGSGGYNEYAVKSNKNKKGKTWEEIYTPAGLLIMKEVAKKFGKIGADYTKNLPKETRIANAKRANKARTEMGYIHSEETKKKISDAQKGITFADRYDEETSTKLKNLISQKTKEAMKNVDRELLGKKSVENRKPYWDDKHFRQRNLILILKQQGCKVKHICSKLDISPPTYYKRLKELQNEGKL